MDNGKCGLSMCNAPFDGVVSLTRDKLKSEEEILNSIDCTIEEMAELIQVLSKFKRNSHKFTIRHLTEELSHVLAMSSIVMEYFNISTGDIAYEQYNMFVRCAEKRGWI